MEGDTLYNYVRNYPSDQIPSVDIRDCMRVKNITYESKYYAVSITWIREESFIEI